VVARPRFAVVVGVGLILGALGGLLATDPSPDVVRSVFAGVAILGAALIIRTVGPSSRPPPPDDDYPTGPPPL